MTPISQFEYEQMAARTRRGKFNAKVPPTPAFDGPERDLHEQIVQECQKRRWLVFRGSTAHRAMRTLGEPDLIIAANNGKTFYCEIKRKGGKLTHDQNIVRHCLLALNQKYEIVYSFEQFIQYIEKDGSSTA